MATTPETSPVRVLDPDPVPSLAAYEAAGGGRGLAAAARLGPAGVLDHVEASGLRGRGGAGFPTGTKWRTVAASRVPEFAATVVVNAAEGEPGTFKDRAIIRANAYRVIEGALIAAGAVGADRVIFGVKATFRTEADRLTRALDEVRAAGWADGIELALVEGPSEYLFGEETALMEVLDGRPPLPRIAPPFRHGVDEVGNGSGSAADVELATAGDVETTSAPPTLVNNVETLANVPGILADGPDWFRAVGTPESPGTIVCTVSGRRVTAGVFEVPMGTPLRTILDEAAGEAYHGPSIVAAMSGVANPLLPEALFDTPLSYEGMAAVGTGLGAAGFIVFDESTDLVAVAAGVARFLAVESCGQCTPCKQDGLVIAERLERIGRSDAAEGDVDVDEIRARLATITDGARCYLAQQHQNVVTSLLDLVPESVRGHVERRLDAIEPELIAPIVDIVDGVATLDETQATKQPDWSHDDEWSGQVPAERLAAD